MSLSLHLPSNFKGFLNLKSLSLVDVSITDEDVACMLSKRNLLEFFEISYCRMVTSIRILHPLNRFKHLVVHICPKLQGIELNCSPTALKYAGTMVPNLIFASTSRLKNIDVVILTYQSALPTSSLVFQVLRQVSRLRPYFVTSMRFVDMSYGPILCIYRFSRFCFSFLLQRTILREGPFKFTYLWNLRLELIIHDYEIIKIDVLDYAYLLKIVPFLEMLELSVSLFHCSFQIQILHDYFDGGKNTKNKTNYKDCDSFMFPVEHGIARSEL